MDNNIAESLYGEGFEGIEPVQKQMKDEDDRPLIRISVNAKIRKGVDWKTIPMSKVVKLCSQALRDSLESIAKVCSKLNKSN